MDWDKLRIFYNVAESGSFTHAATRLNLTQSAISRQMSALEDRLGVPLFHRHARGLLLTEPGEILFRTARDVFADLAMAQARLSEDLTLTERPMTIATTIGFGVSWLAPRLQTFLTLHPEIRLTLKVSDNPVNLTVHESDVAISSSITNDAELIYRELLCRPLHIYASRDYLLKYGVPRSPEDLDRHHLVVFSDKELLPFDDANWLLTCGTPLGIKRDPYLAINNLYGIARAVEAGSGIGCLPPYVAQKCPKLIRILPDIKGPEVVFYFVYSQKLKDLQRISALWTFLKQETTKEEAQIKLHEDGLAHPLRSSLYLKT